MFVIAEIIGAVKIRLVNHTIISDANRFGVW